MHLLPCVSGDARELPTCPETFDILSVRLRVLDERAETLDRSRVALRGFVSATARRAGWSVPCRPGRKGNG
ncbi:hypothetical protein ACFY7C_29135 [Streptomyces sp. NPDC012769]|uniref:hypothetical protein n=1 Tax=Streptomyces sp. NPDC012769 TaxID=3364848 RepID=UPI0036B09F83